MEVEGDGESKCWMINLIKIKFHTQKVFNFEHIWCVPNKRLSVIPL